VVIELFTPIQGTLHLDSITTLKHLSVTTITAAMAATIKTKTFIIGVGMTPFKSPRKSADVSANPASDYLDLAVEAGVKALLDAGITYDAVDQAIGSYVYGDSTCAQRAFYCLGMTGIPIFNVNNNCSSGSTALYLANQAIRSGQVHCVLCLGFDKMTPGPIPQIFNDRTSPISKILDMSKTQIPESERGNPSPGWVR
jgi:sterol carrier protein 2